MISSGLRYAISAAALVMLVLGLFVGGAQPQAAGLLAAPWDKIAHLVVFAVIALLLRAGLGWPAWLVLVLSAALGAADEFHQAFLPGRFPGLDDWFADIAGALLALWLLRLWARRANARASGSSC